MNKTTIKLLIAFSIIAVLIIIAEKQNRKVYPFYKMTTSFHDENGNFISGKEITVKGEVKSIRNDDGEWSEFGIQLKNGHYVWDIISNTQKKGRKTTFDVKDKQGMYHVTIDKKENIIVIKQTESKNNRYLFMTIYLE